MDSFCRFGACPPWLGPRQPQLTSPQAPTHRWHRRHHTQNPQPKSSSDAKRGRGRPDHTPRACCTGARTCPFASCPSTQQGRSHLHTMAALPSHCFKQCSLKDGKFAIERQSATRWFHECRVSCHGRVQSVPPRRPTICRSNFRISMSQRKLHVCNVSSVQTQNMQRELTCGGDPKSRISNHIRPFAFASSLAGTRAGGTHNTFPAR